MWKAEGPHGYESRKIKNLLPRYARGKVLEIGCGTEKAWDSYIGYDRAQGAANLIGDAAHLLMLADNAFDTVFSSHCLEDMEDMGTVLNEWARVLKDGGYMILYLPSANFYPKIGEAGANPNHKHDIYPEDVPKLFNQTKYDWTEMVLQERSGGNEYSIYAVYRKIGKGVGLISIHEQSRPTACIFRTGGFGDIILAATVAPALKQEGYHVTFMTARAGESILKGNPFIDEIITLELGGMAATDIYEVWEAQRPLFDRWINLQNSMENALLSFPHTVEYHWPEKIRQERLDRNYTEFIFELAELPLCTPQVFYPTEEEVQKAVSRLVRGSFNIMFCLAGSSINKKTPHQNTIIGSILHAIPEARLFLVADAQNAFLEEPWRDNPRVECLSGKISLRDTLTLAQQMDLVIGPETGVLMAVAYDPMPKIIYLSHSSWENLTKYWVNTYSLIPTDTACYPCHKIHYKPDTCNVDEETGASMCVMSIKAEDFIRPVIHEWMEWSDNKLKESA